MNKRFFVADEEAMLTLGARMAKKAKAGDLIYLEGDLGAGKTTITRAFLKAFGISDSIKSPTFTLVETYQINDLHLFHFDLYRIKDPKELSQLGLSDYLTEDAICLIEWPENAFGNLPEPTLYCKIEIPENGEGRWVTLK